MVRKRLVFFPACSKRRTSSVPRQLCMSSDRVMGNEEWDCFAWAGWSGAHRLEKRSIVYTVRLISGTKAKSTVNFSSPHSACCQESEYLPVVDATL